MSGAIKTKLEAIKSSNNHNLNQHIRNIIAQLALNKQSVQDFQATSFKLRQGQKPEVVFKIRQAYAHIQQYQKKTRELAGKINTGTEEQPQEPASIGYVPDFLQQARIFQKFGIGFSETQSYLIFKSLARFAHKKNAKQVRLWGKILGRQHDYYVAEGVADTSQQQGEVPADIQPKGTGVNKTLFWVTNQLTGEWTELPVITPQQLQISRRIKYLFSGNLNNQILVNPAFPGTEAHLLKCQLVRIHTSCTVVPKGLYVPNADDPKEIDLAEQYTYPNIQNLTEKQNWVYLNPSILKNGRTTIQKPQGLEPEQEEKWAKQASQKDPSEPRLKTILMDSSCWALRSQNMQEKYLLEGKNSKAESNGVIGLKNLVWPGWLTVAFGTKFQSIYVGYGTKAKQDYCPCQPQKVFEQNEDRNQFVVEE